MSTTTSSPPETKDTATGADEDEYDFDLVVLGAGSGGTRASRWAASQYGARVACVELPFGFVPSDEVGGAGGTCVIRGCVPKKLLVYASAFSEEFCDARGFGWSSAPPPFDWRALIDRKGREVERLNAVYNRLLTSAGVNLFEGRASLEAPHKVKVEMVSKEDPSKKTIKTLTARHILVATGGSAVKAPIPGAEELAITSDDALVLEDLPLPRGSSPPRGPVVLIGAGYIALEFAGIFAGLGCDVRVLYRRDLPLAGFDGECRKHVAECMQGRGIAMMAGTSPTRLVKSAKNSSSSGDKGLRPLVDVHYTNPDGSAGVIEGAALVMFGTGRRPNSANLGLESAGVDLDPKSGAIKVDAFSRTTAPGVWAIGDVTDRMALTPVALMEAMAFCESAFGAGGRLRKPDYDKVPTACFVQPPLAACGLTEEEGAARVERALNGAAVDGEGKASSSSSPTPSYDIFVSKFRPMRNTLSGRNESTLMKMIVDSATDEVVGCHMVGPDAPEIMQGIAVAMRCRARKADFDGTVGIHPSAAEEFVTMRTRTRRVGK